MFQFNRGISQEFVDRLNAEYAAAGWWKAIADDRELFVAIRDGYINVYWKGNSLLKLWQEGANLIGETHYKYLLRPDFEQPYLQIADGKAKLGASTSLFIGDVSDLASLKRSANAYAGEEKKGVHQIVMSNPNVVDVEVAFGTENEKSGAVTANRIDFSALRLEQSGPEIVFYEAKLFANKELRADGDGVPVLGQLRRYQKFLRDGQADLLCSYRKVCGNLASLDGVSNRYGSLTGVMKDISESRCNLTISDDVRLVVFGYDSDQRDGAIWANHRKKLEAGSNLLLKGDAKGFTKGISSPIGGVV